jgi:anti-anti-sigma factor
MRRRLDRDLAALDGLFALLEAFCGQQGLVGASAQALKLVTEELFTNLVRHDVGGGDHVVLRLDRAGDRVVVTLTGEGAAPFDAAEVPAVDPGAPLAERRAGGLGLHLVRSLVEELRYQHEDRTLTVTAVLAVAERAQEVFAGVAEGCTVDLRALDYISSAGIGILIATQKRLAESGQRIVLAHPSRHIRELFGIAGLHHVFDILES